MWSNEICRINIKICKYVNIKVNVKSWKSINSNQAAKIHRISKKNYIYLRKWKSSLWISINNLLETRNPMAIYIYGMTWKYLQMIHLWVLENLFKKNLTRIWNDYVNQTQNIANITQYKSNIMTNCTQQTQNVTPITFSKEEPKSRYLADSYGF